MQKRQVHVTTMSVITGFITGVTRQVPLVEQELPTLSEHMSSPPVFSGIHVNRSLVLCSCFVDRCLSLFDLRILIILLVSSSSSSVNV